MLRKFSEDSYACEILQMFDVETRIEDLNIDGFTDCLRQQVGESANNLMIVQDKKEQGVTIYLLDLELESSLYVISTEYPFSILASGGEPVQIVMHKDLYEDRLKKVLKYK